MFARALCRNVVAVALIGGASAVDLRAAELTFVLPIENGRVPAHMRRIRVDQGDVVHLRWTTNRRIVVHLHGYDIEKEIVPGVVTVMTFTAHATGRFPVEVHVPGQSGGHTHGDTLVRIEVHPR
jgi:hypothetical protein